MNLALHIARKDLRHARLILGIWYPTLILAVSLDTKIELFLGELGSIWEVPTQSRDELELGLVVLIGLLVVSLDLLLRAAIVSKLVHCDSAVGSTAFWLSRPVSGGTLLAGKAILILLTMVLPPIVVQLTVTSQLSGSPSTSTEVFLSPFVSASVFMMLAVLTPNLAGMAVLGGIMAGAALGGFLVLSWLAIPLVGDLGVVDALTSALLWVLLLAVCLTVICHQYLTRRTRRSLVIAFSGILAFLLLLAVEWFLVAS